MPVKGHPKGGCPCCLGHGDYGVWRWKYKGWIPQAGVRAATDCRQYLTKRGGTPFWGVYDPCKAVRFETKAESDAVASLWTSAETVKLPKRDE